MSGGADMSEENRLSNATGRLKLEDIFPSYFRAGNEAGLLEPDAIGILMEWADE